MERSIHITSPAGGRKQPRQSPSRDLPSKRVIWGLFLFFPALFSLLALSQCSKFGAKTQAQEFLKAYYAEVNLQKALDLCHGLAFYKIQQELDLGGGKAKSSEIRERKFSFKLLDTHKEGSDRMHFTYNYDIKFPNQTKMSGKIRLSLAQFEKKTPWKIVNFVNIPS